MNNIKWTDDLKNKYIPFVPSIDNYEEIYDNLNWITKDGRIIKIKDMTTNHIENSINMISGVVGYKNRYYYEVFNNLVDEFLKRKGNG